MGRANSCNVLSADSTRRELWRFTRNGNRFAPAGQKPIGLTDTLPAAWVGKGWSNLWSPRLNVAWLPADKVFLKVLHLPPCEESEILAMVEFQIDKVSPLPLGQIVWTVEKVPTAQTAPGTPRTVLVLVASRTEVEAYLGKLETSGYLADRLEMPTIHELIRQPVAENSAWVYPRQDGDNTSCIIAWWFDGVLQQVTLFRLTTEANWAKELQDQVTNVTWAGEVEGWFTSAPKWHLVAEAPMMDKWLPLLQTVTEGSVDVVQPKTDQELASFSAAHATRNGLSAGLLPAEFATKYQQQISERLWLRLIGFVGLAYFVGAFIYIGILQFHIYQRNKLDDQVQDMKADYDKAQQLTEKIEVVETQISLRFAALEAWKAIALNLPDGLTLTDLSFDHGARLSVVGTADSDPSSRTTDFAEKLSALKVRDKSLFKEVSLANSTRGANGQWRWSFSCELSGGGF